MINSSQQLLFGFFNNLQDIECYVIRPRGPLPGMALKGQQVAINRMQTSKILNGVWGIKETPFYDQFGKPHVKAERHISISHSRDLYAVMVSRTQVVGVDVERMTDRILRIEGKFVNEKEQLMLVNNRNQRALQLYVIWTAKEVMYKIYSKKEVDFKKHLMVHVPEVIANSGEVVGHLSMPDLVYEFAIAYHIVDDWIVAWATGEAAIFY
ncbi:MAG: hypothetical protein RIQ89_2077 [Bacteroidota bacterium]|jgi:4'-phosphopantetheinyl transferase EntD